MNAAPLVGVVLWWPDQAISALLVLAVWTFRAIEYVNYFHTGLSYPVARWFINVGQWRTPQLLQDIRNADPSTA